MVGEKIRSLTVKDVSYSLSPAWRAACILSGRGVHVELVHAVFPVLQFDVGSDVVRLAADLLVLGQHLLDLTVPDVEQRLQLLHQLRVLACTTSNTTSQTRTTSSKIRAANLNVLSF